jgi:hypothetical protein
MGKIFSRNCLHFLVMCRYSDLWNIFLPWRLLALNGVAIFTHGGTLKQEMKISNAYENFEGVELPRARLKCPVYDS